MFLLTEPTASFINFREVEKMSKKDSLSARTEMQSPLILIADEDEDTRLMMKYLLNLWNYRVAEAAADEETFQSAKVNRPDLILISDKFSRIDALATTRRIRELRELDNTVIIFINCFSEPSVQASALAAGANDFMAKPIDFGQLETKLKHFLKENGKFIGRVVGEVL